jgi:hypothetical protein
MRGLAYYLNQTHHHYVALGNVVDSCDFVLSGDEIIVEA